MQNIGAGAAANLVGDVVKYVFLQMKRGMSYIFHHKRRVENFEKKVETLKERRDRVRRDVDVAERNVEEVHSDVKNWQIKADHMIDEEAKEVKDLEGKANNKCFIGLCPNFKSRYQLSKKAEEDVRAVDELLLEQEKFVTVSYPDVPRTIVDAPPRDFEAFDSRKQVFDEIMVALKDPNINILGVYGMPGVGKTTLVKEIARRVQQDKSFDSVVIAAVTQTPDIIKIQDQVAESLGLKLEEKSPDIRATRLHKRLNKEKKILIVFDDVWKRLDLKEVGIPFGDKHKGCTMLLTSRDVNVLSNGMDAEKSFPIGVLKQEEALELFKKMAANSLESPDLKSTAIKIAEKCAGLPIAISPIARALRGKELFEWKDALRQLQRPSPSNFGGISAHAYKAIRFSYNQLESEELKRTFLLCSLLRHNTDMGDLLKYAMGLGLFQGVNTVEDTRNRLLTVVSHLKASCLLLDSYTNSRFDMHDLVRDVAKSIPAKDNRVFAIEYDTDVLNDWPDEETMKSCDRIFLAYASITVKLPDQLVCPKLKLFCMFSRDPSMEIPTNFFKKMKNLKVLDLTQLHFTSLPSSICQLANLRTLCLDQCVLEDISIIGELKNLEILSLVISDIEMLPKEIGQLSKLKLLDLSRCTKLKIIPQGVLSSLCKLEELYMGNSFVQWEAEGQPNASLAEFKAFSACLTALEVHIPNANIIPNDFFFDKLQRYKILIGEAWDWGGEIDEESRTLKLQLHTSIRYLNAGTKMLLDNAENVHMDERTGVEILAHELEDWKRFQEWKNLHIQNGALLKYIIKYDDVIGKIEFPQLKSLTLHNLPNLVSFCSSNNGSTSISPQQLPLFNEKIMVPKLAKLKLSSINIERIWHYQLPKGSTSSMRNLTSLIIEGCANLKYILSPSMVNCLQQLQVFEIIECNRIREVISIEEIMTQDADRAPFSFPRLKILKIEQCPQLKGFINKSMSKDITAGSTTEAVLFNEEVTFPELEKMEISHLRNVKRIWYDQLYVDFFCKLKELKVEHCHGLLNVFPSFVLEAFQTLEMLTVTDCVSIEEVFGIKDTSVVAAVQLRNLYLYRLPKLKHIWSKDPLENTTFQNLQDVHVQDCSSLKCVFPFSIAKGLQRLESLAVYSCGVEEIISKNCEGLDQQETLFEFKGLSFLMLWDLPDLKCFYPGMHTTAWPVLKTLRTYGCKKILVFGQRESPQIQQSLFPINEIIPQLEEVRFSTDDIATICKGQYLPDFLFHIKVLGICFDYNEAIAFPIHFLQRFYNLEKLVLISFAFKELSHSKENIGEEKDMSRLPRIKKLRLDFASEIRHLWNEDSLLENIFTSLETLEILNCHSLINLESSASFENLTTLDVTKCKLISELFTPSKAQNLVHLVTMRIKECEVMKEVVASDDEATYEIIFRELKHLKLHCLPSLEGFCSGNYTFKFPSLEQIIVSQCPSLKSFCQGDLSTSKLQRVQLKETDSKGRWAGNLNATIEQLHKEKVGYRGLKHLNFSKIPELLDVWNRNPQEIVEFKNLEVLEVCKSSNLTFILNPSMVSSLGRLQHLEIKGCNNLEAIIKEEEAVTKTTDDKSILLPLLTSIIIEACSDLRSFYWGSLSLVEFPSLAKIEVSNCPNMTSFVSTFSIGEDKQAIIGDGTEGNNDDLTALFCYKVALPRLETLIINCMGSLKKIWHHQLAGESFCSLNYLWVKECERLLNVFPLDMVGRLQKLDIMVIQQCGSIEGIFEGQGPTASAVETDISFVFPKVTYLKLYWLRKLKCFFPGKHTTEWPSLKQMWVYGCDNIEIFASESVSLGESSNQQPLFWINEATFPNLEELKLEWNDIMKEIWHGQLQPKYFYKLKVVELIKFIRQSAALPQCFFQSLPNLEKLVMNDAPFTHIFQCEEEGYGSPLCELRLTKLPELMHIWKEDCQSSAAFCNLKSIEVRECGDLKNLMPSSMFFANLTTLQVSECHGFMNLMSSSTAKSLTQLTKMIVSDCKMIEEIIALEGDEVKGGIVFNHLRFLQLSCLLRLKGFSLGDHIIEFPALEKLIVNGCPRMEMFSRGNLSTPKLHQVQLTDDEGGENRQWEGNLTIQQMFKERVGYCGLKHLNFSKIPELVDIWNRNPQEVVEFKNLEFLEVCDSNNLKCIFNLSMASSLGQLQQLEIKRCNNLEAVIKEEESTATKATDDESIIFPLLTSIIIEACPDLTSFYLGSPSLIEFPTLARIQISHCPNMTRFVYSRDKEKQAITGDGTEGNNKNDLTTLFCYKAAFPKLEEMAISHLTNLKRIWCDQLHGNSFCNLKELKVENCDQLLNIFPSPLLGVFQRLETLKVTDCGSLEEVFGIKDTCVILAMLLRTLYLYGLPKLKTVLPFSIAKGLQQLESFEVDSCGVEEIVSRNSEGLEQESLFEFNRLSFLILWNLPDLKCFYPGMHTTAWPALKMLRIYECEKILFGQEECPQIQKPLFRIGEVVPQLEEVWFSSDHFATISEGQYSPDDFLKIKVLGINFYFNKSIAFPIHFLQRFYNLEELVLGSFPFQELSPSKGNIGEGKEMLTLPKIKKLKLDFASKIRHLWNEDSLLENIFASLETLQIVNCHSLISLGSSSASFQNLKTLDVSECKGIVELITSSKAQSLERLVIMKITECEMMKEVVASEGDDEATHEIIFRKLEYLELHYLQSLRSFCSGNCTFKFPSLEQVIISQCPSLTSFSHGALSAPILRRVQLKETNSIRYWAGDLNATIEQLHKEKVGYRGLKHLNFSKIPELVDIWSRNPQEILEFKNLEFLEVCNSNNLTCIMNLSMVSSLGRLQQLEIKGCNNLEAVIKEEEATIDDKIVTFRLLKSITMESCPDLTSFYLGSPSLIEFPSLEGIEISHCPSMTTFVSTLWRDEDKQPIIGDGTEGNKNDLPALFCVKAAFPKLEEMAISHLRNVKRIWYDDQLHVDSFCNLKKLKVENCDRLLNIFPSHMLGVFQRLETIIVTDCGSLGEVFGIKDTCAVVAMQLRILDLIRLPRLKSVFPFPIAKGLSQLEILRIDSCGVEEITSKNSEGIEQETLFEFNRLSYLSLWKLPNLERFYSGRHTTAWPVLKKLWTRGCNKIKIFGQPQSQIQLPLFLINEVIPQLEEVTFSSDDISMICDDQFATDFFCHIKTLGVASYLTESAVFPFGFLQRFYNLEWLGVYDCNFRDLSLCKGYGNGGKKQEWTLPKVRHLRLSRLYKIEHLWNEDSPLDHICANLQALDVYYCDSLISLGSSSSASFQNLTTLDVWKCNGIVELITSSKAQSFECLITMKIRDCEMMKEVVASEEDEAMHEITFRKLEHLELHCLQSLKSFCSGNYTFKFPSLERVIVSECPSLKSFSQGALSTPKLRRVQLRKTDSTEHWIGDLNATIEQIARLSE